MASGSKKGKRISKERQAIIQLFRANGMNLMDIAKAMGISSSTVSKYSRGVKILPKHKRQNPMEILNDKELQRAFNYYGRGKIPTPAELHKAKDVEPIDYYLQSHDEGERFNAPLEIIDNMDLQKLRDHMAIPTGFHSSLSLADWIDHYLGRQILKTPPHTLTKLQREMVQFHIDNRRCMFEAFRKAGKTMVGLGIPTHAICENPENNYFIQSEIDRKAVQRVRSIANILMNNRRIIADYGFLPHTDKYKGVTQSWTASEFTVKREFEQPDPTLMALSWTTAKSTGAHFAGGIYDDVWSVLLEQNSEINKEKWLNWYDGEMQGCLEEGAWEVFLLTRKGTTDLYQELEDRGTFAVIKRPAIEKYPSTINYTYKTVNGKEVVVDVTFSNDGIINDPERHSMRFFLMKRKGMKVAKWESEYQLNPVPESGEYISWKNLRFVKSYKAFYDKLGNDVKKIRRYTRHYGVFDFAYGKSDRADWNALGVFSSFEGRFYFLQLYLQRGANNLQRAAMIKRAFREFPYLDVIYAEADLQQTQTVEELQKLVPEVYISPMFSRQEQAQLAKEKEMKKSNLSPKHVRIYSQIDVPLEQNAIIINKNMNHFDEFEREFRFFPNYKHDDVIDILGSAVSIYKHKAALLYALSG